MFDIIAMRYHDWTTCILRDGHPPYFLGFIVLNVKQLLQCTPKNCRVGVVLIAVLKLTQGDHRYFLILLSVSPK